MKQRPILFSGEMVRAILEGHKTQTRRVVKPQPVRKYEWHGCGDGAQFWTDDPIQGEKGDPESRKVPYGISGDQLWVKESFACSPRGWIYKADFTDPNFGQEVVDLNTGETVPLVWKSARFMPRRASRITLHIVDVWVERLREITSQDAIAEGVRGYSSPYSDEGPSPRDRFAGTWDSINSKSGFTWDSNPWVWVIEFRKL